MESLKIYPDRLKEFARTDEERHLMMILKYYVSPNTYERVINDVLVHLTMSEVLQVVSDSLEFDIDETLIRIANRMFKSLLGVDYNHSFLVGYRNGFFLTQQGLDANPHISIELLRQNES